VNGSILADPCRSNLKQFAVRDCHAVAVDIVDDDRVGLGRSRALMEHANVVCIVAVK